MQKFLNKMFLKYQLYSKSTEIDDSEQKICIDNKIEIINVVLVHINVLHNYM